MTFPVLVVVNVHSVLATALMRTVHCVLSTLLVADQAVVVIPHLCLLLMTSLLSSVCAFVCVKTLLVFV